MRDLTVTVLAVLLVLASVGASAQETVWDQEAARRKVQAVLDLEKTGRPWDDIPWLTSIEEAERTAADLNKPVFVFLFIKKPVGPQDAPC